MTSTAARIAAFPVRSVSIRGGCIGIRETGAGEPLLLLHGVGSSSASWVDFMAVAQDYFPGKRLIAWDAPGYGDSSPLPQASPGSADYAAALVALLDALGIDSLVLIGHSLGSLIAGAFAAAHPERVRSLVLLDPAGGYGAATAEARQKVIDGRLGMLAELGPQGMADQRGAALLSTKATFSAAELVKWSMGRVNPHGYAQAVRMLAAGRLAEDVARYGESKTAQLKAAAPDSVLPVAALPVAVMCGSDDTVTPEAGCRSIAAACPGAIYETLPGLGHAGYVEAPHAVAAQLARVLGRFAMGQSGQ